MSDWIINFYDNEIWNEIQKDNDKKLLEDLEKLDWNSDNVFVQNKIINNDIVRVSYIKTYKERNLDLLYFCFKVFFFFLIFYLFNFFIFIFGLSFLSKGIKF